MNKICTQCLVEQNIENFHTDKRLKSGKKAACRTCIYERLKNWRSRNPDKVREQTARRDRAKCKENNLKWNNRNPEYAKIARHNRRAAGTMNPNAFQILGDKYGFFCLKCKSTEKLEIDHVVPVSKQGTNDMNNLQILCMTCNRVKYIDVVDFRPKDIS